MGEGRSIGAAHVYNFRSAIFWSSLCGTNGEYRGQMIQGGQRGTVLTSSAVGQIAHQTRLPEAAGQAVSKEKE